MKNPLQNRTIHTCEVQNNLNHVAAKDPLQTRANHTSGKNFTPQVWINLNCCKPGSWYNIDHINYLRHIKSIPFEHNPSYITIWPIQWSAKQYTKLWCTFYFLKDFHPWWRKWVMPSKRKTNQSPTSHKYKTKFCMNVGKWRISGWHHKINAS